jgi:hypothetical protein
VPILGQRLTLVVALVAMGCGGGGGSYRGGEYRDSVAAYHVGELDPSWVRIEIADNDLAFRSDELGALLQVNATCDPDSDVPLPALRNHLLIGFTERELASEELVPMDGREALRTRLVAKLDGVPREMLLTVLKKDGCVYDFSLVSPPGASFERALPSYDRVLAGFATEAAP